MIPDLSVLWVIGFVLLLAVTLDRLLFKPLARAMQARETTVASARHLAERAAADAQEAMKSFDAQTREARAEIYRQMDEARRSALDRRAKLLADTRNEAEGAIAHATTRLKADTAEARARLERDAHSLATTIVERVLGRQAS
jgi:F0F1-type ATP synthase membrane subunit b/b'